MFRQLPLPAQVALLRAHGRFLAARQEGGVRQCLHDVAGFFVETWHWDEAAAPGEEAPVGLLFSFADLVQLDSWLANLTVPEV